MKRLLLSIVCFCLWLGVSAQSRTEMSTAEKLELREYYQNYKSSGVTDPPAFEVRTPAEWEEHQVLLLSWEGFPNIVRQIADHASREMQVIIFSESPNQTESVLVSSGVDMTNITIQNEDLNTVWIRDFGPWTIYENDVDSLMLVDWIYNRARPQDDKIPHEAAEELGLQIFETSDPPYNLVATGGNFMVDGLGTAFSSELILDENTQSFYNQNIIGYPNSEISTFVPQDFESVLDILNRFMGIEEYITMDVLPYDAIHHIDMHMKLLDEETILIGQYPEGVADGPQIEANIAFIKENFMSPFGTPYKFVRIPMPPDGGFYPDDYGDYRTYANAIFLNRTILVPTYEEQFDIPALDIWREQMPGYNIQGINCNDMIWASGALHCITKLIGVNDPLHIVHKALEDTEWKEQHDIAFTANHRSGINDAKLFYRAQGEDVYNELDMISTGDLWWTGAIPAYESGTTVEYYVQANATSGKSLNRPMPAPEGYWSFDIIDEGVVGVGIEDFVDAFASPVFPNPSDGFTVIPVTSADYVDGAIDLLNINGQVLKNIFSGKLEAREKNYFFDVSDLAPGAYLVRTQYPTHNEVQKLMVK